MTQNTTPHFHEDNIDIKKYLFKFLSIWYLFIISIGITMVVAYYINRKTVPVYSLNATIIVRDETNAMQSGVEGVLQDMGFRRRASRRTIENEIVILKSYNIVKNTIERLDFGISYYSIGRLKTPEMYQNSPFIVVPDTSSFILYSSPIYIEYQKNGSLLIEMEEPHSIKQITRFGEYIKFHDFRFKVELNKNIEAKTMQNNRYYFIMNNIDVLTNLYQSKFTVDLREKNTLILDLSITGNVPQKEANFLNMLAQTYIDATLEEKNLTIHNTVKFIDNQLDIIRDSLKKSEREMMDFRLENKIHDISKEGQELFEYLKSLQDQNAALTLQMHYYNYLDDYFKLKSNYTDIIAPSVLGVNDQVLSNLLNNLATLYSEKVKLQFTVKANSPKIIELNGQIEALRLMALENLKSLKDASKMQLQEIDNRINKYESQLTTLPITERKFINLKRNYTVNDNIFNFLLQKRAESGIMRASNIADAKLIERCRTDKASQTAPKKSNNFAIAIIIGLLVPIGFVLGKDYFNDKIESKKDIEGHTRIPIVGIVAHSPKYEAVPVHDKPKSSLSESFRSLRTNLQYMLRDKDKKVVAITSTISGEGKTFCAVNLAAIVSMSNKKVLVVGLDLRKPKLHKIFDLPNDKGLSTYLINLHEWEETILPTPIQNLYIAPSGPIPPNPAELIETPRMHEFLTRARQEFDFVVIDTPPLAIVTDALLLAQETDANIFVIRQNYSSKHVLELLNDLYEQKELRNFCILINDIKAQSAYGYRYGYSYGYHYGYGYSYGYGESEHGYYSDEEVPRKPWYKRII